MTELIRVVIVDDQPVVRSGVAALLATYPDLKLVGQGADGAEARTLCAELQPDVVLMDLVMPGVAGIQAIREIREECPAARVIALTSFHDENLVQGALEAGALSYILKDVPGEELAHTIRLAHAGKSTLAREAAHALIKVAQQPPSPSFDLSDRELEVLALMVEGRSNAEIALQLSVKPSTAKFHVSNILSKLGVSTRTEAVTIAYHHKLVG